MDDNTNKNNSPTAEENTFDRGSCRIRTKNGTFQCLTVIGEIEGHSLAPTTQKTTKYEYVLPKLVEIEEDDSVDGLLVLLNTVGGDVEAGLAISEMIGGMRKPTVSLVLGGSHSIGVPIAVATKYSFVVPSATMTIHPVRMNGLVIGVPQTFEYFAKMQDRIIEFIVSHSKSSKDKIESLMFNTGEIANDVGSIIDGNKAVEIGLIDEVGNIGNALDKLNNMIGNKTN